MRKLVLGLFLVFVALSKIAEAERTSPEKLCGAFSEQGTFVLARVGRGSLQVSIRTLEGKIRDISMSVSAMDAGCAAFFSEDGTLLAISSTPGPPTEAPIEVAVANVAAGSWLQDQPFVAQLAADARGPVQGFLGSSHALLILSSGTYFSDLHKSVVYPTSLQLPTGELSTDLLNAGSRPLLSSTSAVDLKGGRLWVSTAESPCVFESVPLDADGQAASGQIHAESIDFRSEGCVMPDFVFSRPNSTPVVGFGVGNTYRFVTSIPPAGVERQMIKTTTDRGFFRPLERCHSFGGDYVAIKVDRFESKRTLRKTETDLVILRAEPLTLESVTKISSDMRLVAIEKREHHLLIALLNKDGGVEFLESQIRD